jgi:transcriptional regulator with XRE-family HTH domain
MGRKSLSSDHWQSFAFAFGLAFRLVRRVQGTPLEQLAQESGLSCRLLSQIEKGIEDPDLATVEALARALNVRTSALLKIAELIFSTIENDRATSA